MEKRYTLKEAHKEFAVKSNGRVWQLLEKTTRTQQEDDELLYAVYASSYHWQNIGTGVNQQRAEYLIAKAYLALDVCQRAIHHAQRCMALTEAHRDQMQDFDLAYAHECLARALAAVDRREEAVQHYQQARALGDQIKAAGDKETFDQDFQANAWYGIA